ncbi:MAG: cupin domain-containing protein [Pseudomonadota bacterium]
MAARDFEVPEEKFRDGLTDSSVSPLWDVMANLVTESPKPNSVPHCWNYPELRAHLMRAGKLITAEEAERRVLILENPGTPGKHSATEALYAGLQLVLPGETAPVHRHTQSALRFVLESEGAWTSVDGEPVLMRPFDLVLTPSWRWHEHGGEGAPSIWLDGLDIPIIQAFSAGFAEREGNVPQTVSALSGYSRAAFGSNLKPVRVAETNSDTPLFHFPHNVWRDSLAKYSETTEIDPHRGWMMEFVNPQNGGSVMNTISAFVQMIPENTKTKLRRQSAGSVMVGVSGSGSLTIDGKKFLMDPRNIAAMPSWAGLEIENLGSEPFVLFSYSDRACHEKLGFWREWTE